MTTFQRTAVAATLVILSGAGSLQAAGLEKTREIARPSSSGLVTGLTGAPLLGRVNGATRDLLPGDTVAVAEELRTGKDDMLELLWGRHTLILIRPQSTVLLRESQAGQTEVLLRDGSVRVALAYGGHPADIATVLTPSSRVFTRGGILEVDVSPPSSSLFSNIASVFSTRGAHVETRVETVRVVEGESGVEPLTSTGHSDTLEAGVQARIAGGLVQQVGVLPRQFAKGVGLPDTDRLQGTPAPLTKLIANVHVNHALEVERQLSAQNSALERSELTAQGPDLKGTVVSTSLGVPAIQLTQPGTTSGPVAPTSPSAPTSPLPTLPLTQPGTTNGPADRTPPSNVTSPLPAVPPVQLPTTATLAPNQSGGNNSHHLLKEFLNDDAKGKKHGPKDLHTDHDKGGSGSVAPTSPSTPTSPRPTLPLTQPGTANGPVDHTSPFNVTSPLPTLPPVQVPTTTTMAPNQSGGNNSHHLLTEFLDNGDKGKKHGPKDLHIDHDKGGKTH